MSGLVKREIFENRLKQIIEFGNKRNIYDFAFEVRPGMYIIADSFKVDKDKKEYLFFRAYHLTGIVSFSAVEEL